MLNDFLKDMEKKIYQIKITLNGTRPLIWRRILTNAHILLVDFHRILQTTMGWTNSHLHAFIDGSMEYAPVEFEVDGALYSRTVHLDEIMDEDNPEIVYEYDFGDGWEHTLLLEKVLPADNQQQIPVCIGGKRNCPPEDVGGIWGYGDMLKILKKPGHKEYQSYIEWLGYEFDPGYFNMDEINEQLKRKGYGCIWL